MLIGKDSNPLTQVDIAKSKFCLLVWKNSKQAMSCVLVLRVPMPIIHPVETLLMHLCLWVLSMDGPEHVQIRLAMLIELQFV